ncbi:putative copper homeostasis (lipo)protein LpqS [Nocardia tengchongensis]
MFRGGGSGRLLWALLFSMLVLVAAVTECAAGAGADHTPALDPAPVVGAAGDWHAPQGESAHCDPHVEHAIRTAEPGGDHAPEATPGRVTPTPGIAASDLITALHGERGPPGGVVGGRMLLTRLCIARR